MKKLSSVVAVLILSGAIVASAAASLKRYEVGSKQVKGVGTVGSFSATVKKPYKIILFCENNKAGTCGAKVVCHRGTKVFTWNRTDLGPSTWNLKKPPWYQLDSCRFTASITSGGNIARVVVDAVVRT